MKLIADRILKNRIYPALARHEARPYTQSWREFGQHWPWTIPFRLQEYCDAHGITLDIVSINDVASDDLAYYPIGIGFFDFEIDYIALLPDLVMQKLSQGSVVLLFYYHEGDNPRRIKNRLDQLCQQHQLNSQCYRFISGNSAAKNIPGFVYFPDFEFWYFQRNLECTPVQYSGPRTHDFTLLNRLHKTWRAIAVSDLHRHGLLNNSFWSYCETGELGNDSPIEVDLISRLRWDTTKFLENGPYFCDDLAQQQRNDHSLLIEKFYSQSWCNIVMETHFDADQSGGVFLTEKTFKPIKHGQLFFVAGCAGSLSLLRELGYRTFDSVLDNSYDLIQDATQRWIALREAIAQAQPQLPKLFELARADIEHNQQLFLSNKSQRLNTLFKDIHEQYR